MRGSAIIGLIICYFRRFAALAICISEDHKYSNLLIDVTRLKKSNTFSADISSLFLERWILHNPPRCGVPAMDARICHILIGRGSLPFFFLLVPNTKIDQVAGMWKLDRNDFDHKNKNFGAKKSILYSHTQQMKKFKEVIKLSKFTYCFFEKIFINLIVFSRWKQCGIWVKNSLVIMHPRKWKTFFSKFFHPS